MSLGEYFHVGIIVPDLVSAQARLTELLGTALCNEHSNLHHIGFFSGALVAESNRLLTADCPLEIMGGHGDGPPSGWAYHRDPIGVRIEVVDEAIRPAMEQVLFQANGG